MSGEVRIISGLPVHNWVAALDAEKPTKPVDFTNTGLDDFVEKHRPLKPGEPTDRLETAPETVTTAPAFASPYEPIRIEDLPFVEDEDHSGYYDGDNHQYQRQQSAEAADTVEGLAATTFEDITTEDTLIDYSNVPAAESETRVRAINVNAAITSIRGIGRRFGERFGQAAKNGVSRVTEAAASVRLPEIDTKKYATTTSLTMNRAANAVREKYEGLNESVNDEDRREKSNKRKEVIADVATGVGLLAIAGAGVALEVGADYAKRAYRRTSEAFNFSGEENKEKRRKLYKVSAAVAGVALAATAGYLSYRGLHHPTAANETANPSPTHTPDLTKEFQLPLPLQVVGHQVGHHAHRAHEILERAHQVFVQPGEGYTQVIKRLFPGHSPEEYFGSYQDGVRKIGANLIRGVGHYRAPDGWRLSGVGKATIDPKAYHVLLDYFKSHR